MITFARITRAGLGVLGHALALAAPLPAVAHGLGFPSVAVPQSPECAVVVVDDSFLLTWSDNDAVEAEGVAPALFDLHYTAIMPRTFNAWELPEFADLVEIAVDLPIADPTNELLWDTSAVASGVYWIVARTRDQEFDLVVVSPGPVTVVHGADPVPPSIAVVQPDGPSSFGDLSARLQYCAHDPDGTGEVTLEVTPELDGTDLRTIATGLPAGPDGLFEWDTSEEPQGSWLIRATVTDGRGMSAAAWGRYFVGVYHRPPIPQPRGEGAGEGEGEGAPADTEDPASGGEGEGEGEPPPAGSSKDSSCSTSPRSAPPRSAPPRSASPPLERGWPVMSWLRR